MEKRDPTFNAIEKHITFKQNAVCSQEDNKLGITCAPISQIIGLHILGFWWIMNEETSVRNNACCLPN